MMISNIKNDTEAFVWIWLDAHREPVVAGKLTLIAGDRYLFNYGKSYLEREEAILLYDRELLIFVRKLVQDKKLLKAC